MVLSRAAGGWVDGWLAGLTKTKPNPKLELKFGAELCNNPANHPPTRPREYQKCKIDYKKQNLSCSSATLLEPENVFNLTPNAPNFQKVANKKANGSKIQNQS